MPTKRILCPQRLRRVPPQFSWIDHRLVGDRYICRCSASALALYLLLVTVADAEGLSYYGDKRICQLLSMERPTLAGARKELIDATLIAYQRPLYQVLALGDLPDTPRRQAQQAPLSLGEVLREAMGESQ